MASVLAPLCQPEQLGGEFHSQRAAAFSSGLRYRLITDANAAREDKVQASPEVCVCGGVSLFPGGCACLAW